MKKKSASSLFTKKGGRFPMNRLARRAHKKLYGKDLPPVLQPQIGKRE